jgi:hypothetical protein
MANEQALVDAIDVIVTAPYRVDVVVSTLHSLPRSVSPSSNTHQTLHTIIRSVGDDVIKRWCAVKPCQIPKLATYLIKSLSEERCREVFERFSGVISFSKIVAEQCPELLPQLIAGALEEGEQRCMVRCQYRPLTWHWSDYVVESGLLQAFGGTPAESWLSSRTTTPPRETHARNSPISQYRSPSRTA